MRLGTQRAMQKINEALASGDPELRIEAAAALATRKDAQAVPTLLRALDAEKDDEVQKSILAALGRQGTPEALKRLVSAAAAERGLFRRKSTVMRVAAVHALTEARSPEALETLKQLQADKESDVANAATFGLRRLTRGDGKVNEP